MATICDLCRKTETGKRKMFRVFGGYCFVDGCFSIEFAPEESIEARYSNYKAMICTDCLHKLEVDRILTDIRRKTAEREAACPRLVTPLPQLPE